MCLPFEADPNPMRLPQPFKILIDIWGVITSWDFRHDLNNYLVQNITDFLERNWNNDRLKDFISRLRDRTAEDRQTEPEMPAIKEQRDNNKSEVIQSVVDNIDWRKEHKIVSFKQEIGEFQQSMWSDGYRTKKLSVHVYGDVQPAFVKWTGDELGIKIYTFASGSSDSQKLFLSSTIAGDLKKYVICGFNSFHRYKDDPKRFKQIFVTLLERDPQNILYLTDEPKKAKAAIKAGLRSIVVKRPGSVEHSEKSLKDLQVINSLDQLDFIVAT